MISSVTIPVGFVHDKEAWNLESVVREGFKMKLKIDERPCQRCLKTSGFCSFDKLATQFFCKEDFSFYKSRIKEFSGALLGIKCTKMSLFAYDEVPSLAGTAPGSVKFVLTGSRG